MTEKQEIMACLMERLDRAEDLFKQLIAAVEEVAKQLDHIYYALP